MRHHADTVRVSTTGRQTRDLTREIQRVVDASDIESGLCTVFVHHTSASLILCENADPQVRRDLEAFVSRLCPDGDSLFEHTAEGPDDMPAHVRTVLTQTSIGIPVVRGRLALGTWQGVYLWEHRIHPHQRDVSITVIGEGR
jgi:secondary thiamine-phosphate synthase enzyme